MPNIILITNPKSGNGSSIKAAHLAQQALASKRINVHIVYTEYPGHASTLAKSLLNDFDIIVAIGGDATVNEVAQSLVGTDKIFGIIPCGSRNRLAEHFGIPARLKKAIKIIYHQKVIHINAPLINDQYFFCNAGIGFDTLINNNSLMQFNSKTLKNYFKVKFMGLQNQVQNEYTIHINGQKITSKAFSITVDKGAQTHPMDLDTTSKKLNDGLLKAKFSAKSSLHNLINFDVQILKDNNVSKGTNLKSNDFVVNSTTQKSQILGHKDGEHKKWSTPLNFKIRKEDHLNVIID
ncbi:diacylglycerol kinase family protein [Flammeovirga sp. OC4]|uniref:diacylglycerol/lipid kinase family protein n=1 Tax=Flammeovirga sp. OC4 TaxID=1382345 RepID=UPI0006945EED|nr:diacylglycerol kinase family protein [Flammeovirga sp. OC4]